MIIFRCPNCWDMFPHGYFPCKLIMYSKTYFRGTVVEVTEDVANFGSLNFANKLVSLKVQGECGWEIFSGLYDIQQSPIHLGQLYFNK